MFAYSISLSSRQKNNGWALSRLKSCSPGSSPALQAQVLHEVAHHLCHVSRLTAIFAMATCLTYFEREVGGGASGSLSAKLA